ncbi:MAG: S8 family serine peptidase [Solirubrobacteraceae bacterium]
MKTRVGAATVLSLFALIAPLCASAHATTVAPLPESDYAVRHVCPEPAPGRAGCLALELVPRTTAARAHTHPLGMTRARLLVEPSPAGGGFGLRPQDLHTAYGLPNPASSTQTIALVDAYNDPTARKDLEAYDKEFGLTECPGCFAQVNQNGSAAANNLPFPQNTQELEEAQTSEDATRREEAEEAAGWGLEISLDIEAARATCHSCHILLVEANSPGFENLEMAEHTAGALGATEISNSWGGPECERVLKIRLCTADSTAFSDTGAVITASAGDDGYLSWDAANEAERGFAEYPASSPHVVAVGGTRLSPLGPGGAWTGESVWNGDGAGGGGCSVEFAAPAWQTSVADWSTVGCKAKRAVSDVAADADPYTGLAVHYANPTCKTTYEQAGKLKVLPGWCTIGGTSLASPLIASTFALAGGAHGAVYPAKTLYENQTSSPTSLHDVTAGSNGECSSPFDAATGLSGCSELQEAADCSEKPICLAGPGYDGPTGVGTPHGILAFQPPGTAKEKEPPSEEAGKEGEPNGSKGGESKEGIAGEESSSGAEGSNNGDGPGSPSPSAPGVNSPLPDPSAVPRTGSLVPLLSAPALTRTATAALSHGRPHTSRVAFAFTLNVAARVRVSLAKRVTVRGRTRWQTLPASRTIAGLAGRDHAHLSAPGTLAPGRYRLTLAPVGGVGRGLIFLVG